MSSLLTKQSDKRADWNTHNTGIKKGGHNNCACAERGKGVSSQCHVVLQVTFSFTTMMKPRMLRLGVKFVNLFHSYEVFILSLCSLAKLEVTS